MSRSPRRIWLQAALGLVIIGCIPLIAKSFRGHPTDNCNFDGQSINERYQVQIVVGESTHTFCGIGCAQRWLKYNTRLSKSTILVTDEDTGKPLKLAKAIFVRSSVVTNPVTGNRIHAFGSRASAQRHIDIFRGRLLDENPLKLEETP